VANETMQAYTLGGLRDAQRSQDFQSYVPRNNRGGAVCHRASLRIVDEQASAMGWSR